MQHRVLLVDDDPGVLSTLTDFFSGQGFEVRGADSCAAARGTFKAFHPEIVVLDFQLPDGTALDLLPWMLGLNSEASIIVLTGHGSIDLAVETIREGAEHFLTKPVELETLRVVVERCVDRRRAHRKERAVSARAARFARDPFVGTSKAIRALEKEARLMVGADSPVLIVGETGTGKGVLSRWLHENGPRADEAFVDLNCAGLSKDFLETELFGHEKGAFTGAVAAKEGLFEIADRGTLFLDEIGDVVPAVQPKLLKALEEKTFRRLGDVRDRVVDVRLVAATHWELQERVKEGEFREDLYYRISTLPLHLPALRDRSEDIPVLARDLLRSVGRRLGRTDLFLAPAAEEALARYPWPGNIRELRNVLERAALLASSDEVGAAELRFDSVPALRAATPDLSLTLEEVEKRHIQAVLEQVDGHVGTAAERLGVPRSTLYQRLQRHGLRGSRSSDN